MRGIASLANQEANQVMHGLQEANTLLHTFVLRTSVDGHNRGRAYEFHVSTAESRTEWIRKLETHQQKAKKGGLQVSVVRKLQIRTLTFHDSSLFQNFFAFVICVSFLISLVRSQMVPKINSPADVFEICDRVSVYSGSPKV